jgi:hypothetical protein
MTLTRDAKETVDHRVQEDPEFAVALLDEVVSLLRNGEPETARLLLRDLVNATVGIQGLAIAMAPPSQVLQHRLSVEGKSSMEHLTAILDVLRQEVQSENSVRCDRLKFLSKNPVG